MLDSPSEGKGLGKLQLKLQPYWRSRLQQSLGFIVPLLFFGIVYGLMPLGEVLQFDPDEGIELAKVTLYSQGYSLYDQVWNDQPPLLTILLAEWLRVFGTHIESARILVLGFSTIIVGAFYNSLRLSFGIGSALLGTTALCLTLNFLRLSVSVMRGLPAIALAMLGIYFLLLATTSTAKPDHHQPSGLRLGLGAIASGICFGLSLQIKFLTALLLPAGFLHLLLGWYWHKRLPKLTIQHWVSPLLWVSTCSATFIVVGLVTHSFNLEQLLGIHLDKTTQRSLQREPSWLLLLMFLAQDLDYSLLAGIGIWQLWKAKVIHFPALPLTWLITVLAVLSFHQPLWDHYYPLISIPVVWLATYGVTQSYSILQQKHWLRNIRWRNLKPISVRGLATGFLILAIVLVPVKLTILTVQNSLAIADTQSKSEIIQNLNRFRAQTHWLLTDLPITSFYTGLKVPPETAVFSNKRIESGSLNPANLLTILQRYQPEQVLLGRYHKLEVALQPYLQKYYVPFHSQDQITQYVLKQYYVSSHKSEIGNNTSL